MSRSGGEAAVFFSPLPFGKRDNGKERPNVDSPSPPAPLPKRGEGRNARLRRATYCNLPRPKIGQTVSSLLLRKP